MYVCISVVSTHTNCFVRFYFFVSYTISKKFPYTRRSEDAFMDGQKKYNKRFAKYTCLYTPFSNGTAGLCYEVEKSLSTFSNNFVLLLNQ